MPSRLPLALLALAYWLSTAHANARLVGGEVAPPLPAWTEFCGRLPTECAVDHTEPEIIILTPETRELIEAVNHYVNRSLTAMLDEKHWGKIDQWDLPSDGYGDCEDYQLLKRKLLVEAGLPRRALRMTIVIDEMEKGHALLTVRTPGEDRSAPDEWSGTNVSSGPAGAPRVAWPAELVGVAEPAMRRELARTPRGPVPCNRGLHAAGRRCNAGASSR